MAEISADDGKKFDVFLSFRGEDTRRSFTTHLYEALVKNGIKTFMDEDELERGRDISPNLLEAIGKSKSAIVVFSENYANSRWCLDELAKIYECKDKGLIVFPVFCDVDPSDIRKQQGRVKQAFEKHKEDFQNQMEKVDAWRSALNSIASVSGWHLKDYRNEYPDAIRSIITKVSEKLHPKEIVGMDSRIRRFEPYLKRSSEEVHKVGIWGTGGIGKTTFAEEVFERNCREFAASCFVYNVREECEREDGLTSLKKYLDEKLFNNKASTKVLIILDDVDKTAQIEALVGEVGPGSRILITTRDKSLLEESGVTAIYEVEKLTDKEALELFSWKAFRKSHPNSIFEGLSKEFVNYAGGLPLALEVLGGFLHLHRSEKEWKGELNRLRESPHEGITKALRFSYDALNAQAKEIFLDIACFFKGEDESRLIKIFESCDFYPDINLRVLAARSLITIKTGKVWMHGSLQQLGWEIVCKDQINEPERHSRLWRHKDALFVLQEKVGTGVVQGIFLTPPREEKILSDPFKKMRHLRLLKICNVKFSESHDGYYLSRELRLLEWHGYPLMSLSSSFQSERLVELSMPNSHLEQLWKETKHLENLVLINLSNCQYLTETPDFSFTPNLARLVLEDCKSLSELHPSIGDLQRLVLLNLKGCENLKRLPQRISLKSLTTLLLCRCSNLKEFPDVVGDMKNLSELDLEGTGIRELPTSVTLLTGLIIFSLSNCKNLLNLQNGILRGLTSLKALIISGCVSMDELPEDLGRLENLEEFFADGTPLRKLPLSIVRLKSLKTLSLRRCGLVRLPDDIGCLLSLQYLNLAENNFSSIPESISQLSELNTLYLFKCSKLLSLPKHFPINLDNINAGDCPMLTGYSKTELTVWTSKKGFHFINCLDSSSVDEERMIHAPLPMPVEHVDLLFPKFIEEKINGGKRFEIRFPCTTIPLWCTNLNTKSPLKIELSLEDHKDEGRRTKGFALLVVFIIKELKRDKVDEAKKLKNNFYINNEARELESIFCHFHVDERPLEKTLGFASFKSFRLGSFGVCQYVPFEWFGEQLSKSSGVIVASFSINRLDVELRMFGIHPVFEKDVKKFSEKLSQSCNEHLDLELSFSRHCRELFEGANELESSGNITTVKPRQRKEESSLGVPHNEAEHNHAVWDDMPSIEHKNYINETHSMLLALFQGSFARCNIFQLIFPFPILSPWFFHHSVGNVAICYIPPNICKDRSWLGLELYVKCKPYRSEYSALKLADLDVDLYAHGKGMLSFFTCHFKVPIRHFVAIHIPRNDFPEELNKYEGISAFFKPATSDVEVVMCGARLLYEQYSKLLSEKIIESIFFSPFLLRVVREAATDLLKNYQSDDDESDIAFEREMSQPSPITTYTPRERNIILSSHKLQTSTDQLAKEVSTSLDEYRKEYAERQAFYSSDSVVLHSKRSFFENWDEIQEDTSENLSATFNHLHIMAESLLRTNDSQDQIKTLKVLLREFFNHRVLVTLSLKGDILFVLKHFSPCSPYSLCFPQKGIPEWFEYQHVDSKMGIALPSNLSDDKSWRGLVVCASFSVKEHPDVFLKGSIRLLCHLSSEGCCINPATTCCVTKDKIKWFYLRGFIWMTYIPRVLLAVLSEKPSVEAKIYSYCPGLVVEKSGMRLLYEKDTKELEQTIIQCCTSFVEERDLIDRMLACEDDEYDQILNSCRDHRLVKTLKVTLAGKGN